MPVNLVEREDRGSVALLTMNSSERLNVLSEAMLAALQAEFAAVESNEKIRTVILAARGKAFCAGHDLREMNAGRQAADRGRAYFQNIFESCSQLMMSIVNLPQPVIAQVQGIATAAGCQLVASCDMAVASSEARFGVNGVNIGLFCSTPMVALSRNISRKKTMEMLVTGQFIDASEAHSLGLVNSVAEPEDLPRKTLDLAELVASKLGSAVRIGKQAFYKQLQMPLADAYAYTGRVMVENMLHQDTEEGISAFLDKRAPDW